MVSEIALFGKRTIDQLYKAVITEDVIFTQQIIVCKFDEIKNTLKMSISFVYFKAAVH